MDYLRDAQKAHEMAKSMVANGLAANINDAFKLMQNMSEQAQQPVKQEVKMENNDNERLAKIENFLQRFDKFFSKFYEDTTKRFNELNKELNEMRDKIDNQRVSSYRTPEPIREEVKQTAPNSNQRIGGFKPSDIDINDIFSNAGNKMMKR